MRYQYRWQDTAPADIPAENQANLEAPLHRAPEYEAVARREAQHLWLHPSRIEDVLDFLAASGQEHAVSFRWRPFLNDSDDDFILELAVAANARYIVTHNLRNFTGVESFGLEAVTPAQMLLKLQEKK
jgi:predicted nucleic acid-binding protein